ncbi:MAG: hypothetical protein CL983_05285 [Euryarchaeota archaeon]|nr:hypothetical protein [Euryarchaeota archaeon]|tara:strand:- start:12233 stop:12688 length:456 start_codon:yes stop_codon:yes gene_type:complete
MGDESPRTLEVFSDCISVMLKDGVLTREERRLIAALSKGLELEDGEPLKVYEKVKIGEKMIGGNTISRNNQLKVYQNIYEVALIGALSKDEWRILAFLRQRFDITENEHKEIQNNLKNNFKERYEPKVVESLFKTIEDSATTITKMIGRLF